MMNGHAYQELLIQNPLMSTTLVNNQHTRFDWVYNIFLLKLIGLASSFFYFMFFKQTGSDNFSFTFNFINDKAPVYYTTVDDNTVIFDSYDSAVDSTLQSSKTVCSGSRATVFAEEDSTVLNLQPHQFALLLNEAKSLAWEELKQTRHIKAETTARRNWIHQIKTKESIPVGEFTKGTSFFEKLPNFGRK